jgi:Pectate lyase superfamily protein
MFKLPPSIRGGRHDKAAFFMKSLIVLLVISSLFSCLASSPIKPALNVKDKPFLAIGDGITDDRTAIQTAIDTARDAGGGEVLLPAGTYRVTLAPKILNESALRRVFTIYPNVHIRGATRDSSTIKLADNQVGYGAIFSPRTFGTDVTGFELRSLTLDQNTTNNPVNTLADVAINEQDFSESKIRAALWVATGKNMIVQGCRFTDIKAIWTVFMAGNTERVEAITISDNLIENVGGGNLDFDTSQIYTETNGAQSRISNNTIVSRNDGQAGSLGLRTGIEVHGDNIVVEGNTIRGFLTGLNVGSSWTAKNNTVRNNRFENVNSGVVLWADAISIKPPPDIVMRDIVVANNSFTVDVGGWQTVPLGKDATYAAIKLEQQGAKDRQLENIEISNNSIQFLNITGTDHEIGDRYSAGIHYNRGWASNPNNLTTNLKIVGNTVKDSPAMGIYVNAPVKNAEVNNNTIINPGSSYGAKKWVGWQSGIFLQDKLEAINVLNNSFSGQDLQQGIYAMNTVIGDNIQGGNSVSGSSVPAFVRGTGEGTGIWKSQ